jgi:diguanylate cyclase
VSIGVSALRKGDTSASLIERADRALYLAKQSGKNRAVSEKDVK